LSLTPARSEALALFGQKGAFCKGLGISISLLTAVAAHSGDRGARTREVS